jgi:hypothetical protein
MPVLKINAFAELALDNPSCFFKLDEQIVKVDNVNKYFPAHMPFKYKGLNYPRTPICPIKRTTTMSKLNGQKNYNELIVCLNRLSGFEIFSCKRTLLFYLTLLSGTN